MTKEPEYRPLVPKEVPYVDLTNEAEPKDKYNAAWLIFLIMGTGILLPWNAFINAGSYFTSIYPNFGSFIFFLSLVYNWSSCLTLVASLKVAPKFSFRSRILVCFTIDLVMLLAVPWIDNVFSTTAAIVVTYIACFFTGMATSVLFGTVFGLSALFPPDYAGAIMSGNGIAGVLCSVLSIITFVATPDTTAGHRTSGLLFFSLASLTIVVCIGSYFVLQGLPITQYHTRRYAAMQQAATTVGTEGERLINGESKWQSGSDAAPAPVTVRSVFRKIWLDAATVWSVFFVTLALFPGIMLKIEAPHGLADWWPIILITIFCVGDYIGRTVPRWVVVLTPRTLVVPVLVRYMFFVIFPLCIHPELITQQWALYLIMVIFALSNGYLGTLAMMFGPTKAEVHEKETAGFIMTLALNFGIFCGVHFAFLLLYLIEGNIGVKF